MTTWLELDKEFQALAPNLRGENLQFLWGIEGDHYSLNEDSPAPVPM